MRGRLAGREPRLASRRFSRLHPYRSDRSCARPERGCERAASRVARVISIFSVLVVVAYVVISVAVIVVVARKKGGRIAGVVAAGLFLLGTWDVILGRAALWYSCEFKRVISLPAEKIPLSAKYYDRFGRMDWSLVKRETQYSSSHKSTPIVDWLGLEEFRSTVIDNAKTSIIAINTSFLASPGWLERFVSPGMASCSDDGTNLESAFVKTSAPR